MGSLQLELSTPNPRKWVFPKNLHLYRFLSEVRASEWEQEAPQRRQPLTYFLCFLLSLSMLEALRSVRVYLRKFGKQKEEE